MDLASGALLIVAAIAVYATRPGARLNRAFAAYSASLGLAFVALNSALAVRGDAARETLLLSTTAAATLVAAISLARFTWLFPRPPTPAERHRLRPPTRILFVTAIAYFAAVPYLAARHAPEWSARLGYTSDATTPYYFILAIARVYFGAVWIFGAWMALRFLALPSDDERRRRECAYGVVFVLLYGLAFVGVTLINAPTKVAGLIDLGVVAILAFAWLFVGSTTGRPRVGRNVAWFLLGTTLLFLLTSQAEQTFARVAVSGLLGLSRTIALLILGYAILRHQLFDIDLRLKVTLRRSTVVAAFGAAFFVGSELLEKLIPANGTLLGLLAAGAVALALRPIQNVAQRAADRILPGVETKEYLRGRKIAVYRAAFDADAADGSVSARERTLLEALRRELGLTSAEAGRVEAEARSALKS